jgi:hypothetical protein
MGKKKIDRVRELCDKIEIMKENAHEQYVFGVQGSKIPEQDLTLSEHEFFHKYFCISQRFYNEYREAYYKFQLGLKLPLEILKFLYREPVPSDIEDLLIKTSKKLPFYQIKKIADKWMDELQTL